mgnify:CR=1 FL=1
MEKHKTILIGYGKFAKDFIDWLCKEKMPVMLFDKAIVTDHSGIATATVKNNVMSKLHVDEDAVDSSINNAAQEYDNIILMSSDTCSLADLVNYTLEFDIAAKKCIAITTKCQRVKHAGIFYLKVGRENILQVDNNYNYCDVVDFISKKNSVT